MSQISEVFSKFSLNWSHLQFLAALSQGPLHGSAAALQLDGLSLLGFQFCFDSKDLSPSLCLTDPLSLLPLPLEPLLLQTRFNTLREQKKQINTHTLMCFFHSHIIQI